MTQIKEVLIDDIFFIESRSNQVWCSILNDKGELHMESLGAPFAMIAKAAPWAHVDGEKGFAINFKNVERYDAASIEKGKLSIPLIADKGEVLDGTYSLVSPKEFPQALKPPFNAKEATAIVFRPATVQGYPDERRLVLVVPFGINFIRSMELSQKGAPQIPLIRVRYSQTPPGGQGPA